MVAERPRHSAPSVRHAPGKSLNARLRSDHDRHRAEELNAELIKRYFRVFETFRIEDLKDIVAETDVYGYLRQFGLVPGEIPA